MRSQFAAWYPFSTDERAKFVTNGMVVLDTNVLLDFYRMTSSVRTDIIELLRRLGDRLWIPHHVGLEFHRNRLSVIFEQEQADIRLRAALADARARLSEAAKGLRDHPAIDKRKFLAAVDEGFGVVTEYLDSTVGIPFPSVKSAMSHDPVLDAVTELFSGKVGLPYDETESKSVHAEAKRRIEQRRPPGYADAKKDPELAFGDYTLWRQTLDEATKRKLPILLVTNDQKEDWVRRIHGLTIGPRTELVQEMADVAGVPFNSQTLARFVETAPSYLSSTIHDDTVVEVSKLDEQARSRGLADRADADDRERAQSPNHDAFPVDRSSLRASPELTPLLRRQADLTRRISQLRRDLARTEPGRPEDPRSLRRAIEVRIEVAEQALADLVVEIATARDASTTPRPERL